MHIKKTLVVAVFALLLFTPR